MPLLSKLTDKLGDMMKEKLGGHGNEHEASDHPHDGHQSTSGTQQQYEHQGVNQQAPLPPGWIQQWDESSQRYYYVEQSTGRSQWDPPVSAVSPYGPPPGQHYSHEQTTMYAGDPSHGEQMHVADSEKKSSHTGMAFLGGTALGAVGGAWAGHEYSEHQGEHHHESAESHHAHEDSHYSEGHSDSHAHSHSHIHESHGGVAAEGEGEEEDKSEEGSVAEAEEEVDEEKDDVEEAQEELEDASDASDREEAAEELEEEQEELDEAEEELEEEEEEEE